jgi:hypothetical protein
MKKLINYLLITSSILVQAQNTINLPEGWSLFGYNCEESTDVITAFGSIIDNITIVKDSEGETYLPQFGYNGIGNFYKGVGYQIKMNETVIGFQFCEAVIPEDGISQTDVDAQSAISYSEGVASVIPEDGITQSDVDAVQALLDAVVPEDGITQSDVDAVQALLDAVVPEDGITQSDVDAVQALLDAVVPEDGITQSDVDAVQALLDAVVPEDGITQVDVDAVQALLDAVVPEDGITQSDVDAVQALLDAVVPEDGVTQSDVDAVQALLDAVVPEDGIGQDDVYAAYLDGVESVVAEDGVTQDDVYAAYLDGVGSVVAEDGVTQVDVDAAYLDGVGSVVAEDGVTQSDVDAAYLDGVGSVVPEDGITQANVDSAVSVLQEEYIGWCLSDIDNDGICDVDEVAGCMDTTACNYTPEAEFSDASCTYPETNYDCEGNLTQVLEIGALMHGGIVFYIDETGEHGLVAALEDLTEGSNMGHSGIPEGFEWGCYGTSVVTAYQNYAIGTGLENTQAIVSQNCQTENGGITAAKAALDYENEGYTNWFLPSFNELEEMYNTIGNGGSEGNIGGFETSDIPYWSSSEINSNLAWVVNFGYGGTDYYNKSNSLRVRAVRAF